jgi:hypothetical protein
LPRRGTRPVTTRLLRTASFDGTDIEADIYAINADGSERRSLGASLIERITGTAP